MPHGRYAANSTHAPRREFFQTYMPLGKTDFTAFASADAKLCEAFMAFFKFNTRSKIL